MKKRFTALDGLRGFAALSVVLSHINTRGTFLFLPVITHIYRIISDGPNSVQIFFVLSGFLMAYLYSSIPHAIKFIQKRYTRIFPLLFTIVSYIWFVSILKISAWHQQLMLLIFISLFIHFIWSLIKKFKLGKIIFYLFLSLQVISIIVAIVIIPHFHSLMNDISIQSIMNISLTTSFFPIDIKLRAVFWSLAPEILFYILFPFLVIPLMKLGEKYGPIASTLIAVCMIKILFDLDFVFYTVLKFQGLNIARSSGFIVGIFVAEIYRSKNKIWEKIEKKLRNSIFGYIILFLLLFSQVGDLIIRDGKTVLFSNFYFLASSIAIGLAVFSALISGTIVNKIFSHKILVFLGTISYSIYLIHSDVIDWVYSATSFLKPIIKIYDIYLVFTIIAIVAGTVILSFFLYKTIEFMYFISDKRPSISKSLVKKLINKKMLSNKFIGISTITICLLLVVIYNSRFTPSFILEKQNINNFSSPEISILNKKLDIPFYPKNNNLSIISFDMAYVKSAEQTMKHIKNPSKILFRIYDDKNNLLFESRTTSYLVEGTPQFEFGFPSIINSKGKKYIAEFSPINGRKNDHVVLSNSSFSMINMYSLPSKTPLSLLKLIFNRIIFAFTIPEFIFAFGFFTFVAILQNLELAKINKK